MGKPFPATTRICDAVADDIALIRRLVAAYPALVNDGGAVEVGGQEWAITFDEAARMARVGVDALLGVANNDDRQDEAMGRLWFEGDGPHLDVRGLEPPQPMVSVMRLLEGPETNNRLIVHLDREPIYLLPHLAEAGWEYETVGRETGEVCLAIRWPTP